MPTLPSWWTLILSEFLVENETTPSVALLPAFKFIKLIKEVLSPTWIVAEPSDLIKFLAYPDPNSPLNPPWFEPDIKIAYSCASVDPPDSPPYTLTEPVVCKLANGVVVPIPTLPPKVAKWVCPFATKVSAELSPTVRPPVNNPLPTTCKAQLGELVPIPTLQSPFNVIIVVSLLLKPVKFIVVVNGELVVPVTSIPVDLVANFCEP